MIERWFDEEAGIIRVRAAGVWTAEDVDAHYEALRVMMGEARKAGHRIRILSDITEAARQVPDVEQRALWQMTRTYGPDDRVALLAADVGDQSHVRSLRDDFHIKAFASPAAAEMWLFLDELTDGARTA